MIAKTLMLSKLHWMAAHASSACIGRDRTSDGQLVSHVDHRANALVDALAKFAANRQRVPHFMTKHLQRAATAIEHAAALVGAQCKAANNFL